MTSPLPSLKYPEERRLATVLFADVQGFTALSERLDYEIISELIKEVWLRLDTIIEANGGYIDKHIGDAVMAVWGAPFAGENDAERAVTAALELQDALKEFVSSSHLAGADELKIRVGINSGQVLAGYVGLHKEYTVMGDTVNVANRIEQIAEAGTVLIGESTFWLVRGAFQVKRLSNPLQLKGRTEPVPAYVVEGAISQPSRMRYRSEDTLETHMVGREKELQRLSELFSQVVSEDKPRLVMVVGEAGLGKSRILMEFSNSLEVTNTPVNLISARALAQAIQVPFYLWKAIWYLRFGLQDSDAPEITREKFLREIQRVWGFQLGASSVEAAHLIGGLAGLSWPESPYLERYENDPVGRVKRTFELTLELVCRMCAFHPTILIIDDIQFADPGSLELLAYLLETPQELLPLFMLASTRQDFLRHNPRWANKATILELSPLIATAETVMAAYPALHSAPKPFLEELAVQTDGNPYFLEEMVKDLLRANLLKEESPLEQMLESLRARMPESLRVMLQARLDALSHEARSVALLASVVGRVFWVGGIIAAANLNIAEDAGDTAGDRMRALTAIHPTVVVRVVQDALRQLVRAELAFPKANSSFSAEQEYIFKHALLREVAYSMLPIKFRSRYHQAVAGWLAGHERADFKIMAAEHFELGGALIEAAQNYEAAAEFAMLSGAIQEAKNLLEHARQLRQIV